MRVDDILEVGSGNAKKSRDIARYLGIPVRSVNEEVRELIRDGVPVAATSNAITGGYFITDTSEEAVAYIANMKSRIIELAKRMRDYKRAARPILYPGQLPLV